jgi:hypothetical protein
LYTNKAGVIARRPDAGFPLRKLKDRLLTGVALSSAQPVRAGLTPAR